MKLRNDKFWQEIAQLAEIAYDSSYLIIDAHPEEEWNSASKLRNSAIDMMFYASQALGGKLEEHTEQDWDSVRKNLFSLQSIYIFAGKQHFLELDPDVVVIIDRMIKEVDERLSIASKALSDRRTNDLQPWLEKYKLWQKMHK